MSSGNTGVIIFLIGFVILVFGFGLDAKAVVSGYILGLIATFAMFRNAR